MVFPFILCFPKFQGKLLFQLVQKHPFQLSSDQITWISNSFGQKLIFCSVAALGGVKLVAPWLRQLVQLFGTTVREIRGSRPRGCFLSTFWYINSISKVLVHTFIFSSLHCRKMGGSQGGGLDLLPPRGILEVIRISKGSFRSAAYSPYIARLPFTERCPGRDFPLD